MAVKLKAIKFKNCEQAVEIMLDSLKNKEGSVSGLPNTLNEPKLFKEVYCIPNKWYYVNDNLFKDTNIFYIGADEYKLLKDKGFIVDEREIEVGKTYALERDRKIKCFEYINDTEIGDEDYFKYNGHIVKKGTEVKILDSEYLEYVMIKVGDKEVEVHVPEFDYEHYKEFKGIHGNFFDLIYG